MALATGSKLLILSPFRAEDFPGNAIPESICKKLEAESSEKFHKILSRIGELGDVDFEFRPQSGYADRQINTCVKNEALRAIVIAHRIAKTIDDSNPTLLQNLVSCWGLPFIIVPEPRKRALSGFGDGRPERHLNGHIPNSLHLN